MNITILTYGSRGDLQPFLALAVALQKAGHTITLAAPGRFSLMAGEYPIRFVPLAGDPAEISKRINAAGGNVYRMVNAIRDYVLTIAPQVVEQVERALSGADLLVHSFLFTTGGHTLARHLGIPDISIQTFPMFAPTGDYPNVAFPELGRAGNYFSHWLSTQMFWYGGNSGFKRIQPLLPDSFPSKLYWPFAGDKPRPLLIACSPSVIPASKDWPIFAHMTGYFFVDDEHYEPPIALARFLEDGAPPVCVTFGSMINQQAESARQMMLETLLSRQERVVLLTGWDRAGTDRSSQQILFLDEAPHAWLLPRCKAVIHHGGAGTTAAGLRAGIPNLVIAHTADQPFWGRRVHAIGAGPRPIPIRKLNRANLNKALDELEKPEIIKAARAIGVKIQAENGLKTAIELIEREKGLSSLKNRNL